MKTLRSLHGGSETGDVDFAKSINASIDIIEVNSELVGLVVSLTTALQYASWLQLEVNILH